MKKKYLFASKEKLKGPRYTLNEDLTPQRYLTYRCKLRDNLAKVKHDNERRLPSVPLPKILKKILSKQ